MAAPLPSMIHAEHGLGAALADARFVHASFRTPFLAVGAFAKPPRHIQQRPPRLHHLRLRGYRIERICAFEGPMEATTL